MPKLCLKEKEFIIMSKKLFRLNPGLIVFFVGFGIAVIGIITAFITGGKFQLVFTFFGIGFAICFIGIIVAMVFAIKMQRHFFRRFDQQQVQHSPLQIEPYENPPASTRVDVEPQNLWEDDIEREKVKSAVHEERIKSQSEAFQVDWKKIRPLIFRGSYDGQTCGICKLTFSFDDLILQCPHCFTLFHDAHLIEWLAAKSSCKRRAKLFTRMRN